jgi:antitoxin YefM
MSAILTASDARKALFRLIDQVSEEGTSVVISGPRNDAVLVSRSEWEDLQETLLHYSHPRVLRDLMKASEEDHLEVGISEADFWNAPDEKTAAPARATPSKRRR